MAKSIRCKDCKHDNGKCLGLTRKGYHKYCFEPKVVTNADRIRAMTDEELGEFLGDWAQSLAIWRQDSNGEVLYWLQQPCESEV